MTQVNRFMSCHVMSCHVMSCHVMSCRHYYRLSRIFYCINHGINSFKNSCSFLSTKKHDNNAASAHCVEISEGRKIVKGHKGLKPLVIRNWDAEKYDNNAAFPKNAKKYDNNAAFPKGRLWRAHCVNGSEKSTQGVSQTGRRAKTALLLRIWNFIYSGLLRSFQSLAMTVWKWIATPSARNDDNNVAFPKNAKKHDNNVAFPTGRLWRAHCVNNSGTAHKEFLAGTQNCKARKGFPAGTQNCKAHKGLKPLVIRIYSSILCGLLRSFQSLAMTVGSWIVRLTMTEKNIKSKNQFGIMSLSDYGSCYKNYSTERNNNFRNNCDFKNHNSNFCFDGDKIYNLSRNLSGFLFNKKIFKKNKNQGEKK